MKFKKTMLALGTIAAITAPVVSVVSCTTNEIKESFQKIASEGKYVLNWYQGGVGEVGKWLLKFREDLPNERSQRFFFIPIFSSHKQKDVDSRPGFSGTNIGVVFFDANGKLTKVNRKLNWHNRGEHKKDEDQYALKEWLVSQMEIGLDKIKEFHLKNIYVEKEGDK